MALIHNAMLRGLNAIFLQVSHVRQNQDVADLLFLTQSWSAWLLDHHSLKEGMMLPGFEAVLGVPTGTLTLASRRSRSAASSRPDSDLSEGRSGEDRAVDGGEKQDEHEEGEGERGVEVRLHRVLAYASATRKHPPTYNAATLEGLLVSLANSIVPHLTRQIQLFISMRDRCLSFSAPSTASSTGIPTPLPAPQAAMSRTAWNVLPTSASLPISPPVSSSSSSATRVSAASASARSPPTVALSLFPASSDPHRRRTAAAAATNDGGAKSESDHSGPCSVASIDMDAQGRRLAHARALLTAEDRAAKLMQVYLSADARATASMDHFVVLPMMVRLRDTTPSSHSSGGRVGHMSTGAGGLAADMGVVGIGGERAGDWPRMSIPAVHAIADKLSLRHEGAWRFLPCDVWGRPRELPFSG